MDIYKRVLLVEDDPKDVELSRPRPAAEGEEIAN